MREKGIPIAGPYLQMLARDCAKKILDNENLSLETKQKYISATFGKSWLKGFKSRNIIRKLRINGERASITVDVDELMRPIQDFIAEKNIPISNIFNMDETGLFYRSFPKYTLAQKNDDGAGLKEDKSRITILFSVNGDGTKKSIYMVGKSKTPRGTTQGFFENFDIKYFYNKTAWMTSEIFNSILVDMDKTLDSPAILIIDNFSGHSIDELDDLKNIIPVFLPPNTTAKTQPLDAGIIANFKIKYRAKLLRYACDEIQNNVFSMNAVNLKMVIPWINNSFNEVSPLTIQKCFFKTLKLDIFQLAAEVNETNLDLEILKADFEKLVGKKVEENHFLDFIFNDDVIDSAEDDFDDYEEEVISIPDAQKLFVGLEEYLTYFINTSCFAEVKYVKKLKKKLKNHLEFK